MTMTAVKTLFAAACLLLLLSTFTRAAEEKQRFSPAEVFLREAWAKLEDRTFGPKDRAEGERLLARARPDERPPLLLVLARYHRVMEQRPLDAGGRYGNNAKPDAGNGPFELTGGDLRSHLFPYSNWVNWGKGGSYPYGGGRFIR